MTTLIVAANVIVFALMLLTGKPTSGRTLIRFGALTVPLPSREWWRLITSMFVHIGFAHIAFNMFALLIFGGAIENRYGKLRYLMLYLGSGVLGSATSLAFSHGELSAGASGAIFGVIGAGFAMALVNRHNPAMRAQLRSWAVLIALNIFIGVATPGIDLRAHAGGFLGGLVIAGTLELAAKQRGGARAVLQAFGYLAVAITAYLLTAAHVV
jgi:rhomboid protease GluP